MHKKRITYIILGIGILGIISGIFSTDFIIQSENSPNLELLYSAEISNSTINYPQNVERMLDPFDVTVNLSGTYPNADFVEMTITYNNGTGLNYTLSENSDIWSHSMFFGAQDPLGASSFQLFIYELGELQETSSIRPFTLLNSPPRIGIELSNNIIYRNETLFFNVTPTDPEDYFGNLTWSWEIFHQTDSKNDSAGINQITGLSHHIPAELNDNQLGEWSLVGTVMDQDGGYTVNNVTFIVENNNPNITKYEVSYPETEGSLLRSTEHFNLKVNVSDVEELPDDIELRVKLYGPGGFEADRTSRMVKTNLYWDFDGNISLPISAPIGDYTCAITAHETVNNIEYNYTKFFEITLLNNIPNASQISCTINNQIPTIFGIRIKEFEPITFRVNVTDVDPEGIDIIQIQLIPDSGDELLFSFANNGSDTLFYTIYAKDIYIGRWTTWIWVIDSDGERIQASTSYSFDIIPHRFPKVLPWIMLVIGAVSAFGIAMAFLGTRYIKLHRDFDNLLSRTGDYKKSDEKSTKSSPESKKETITTEKPLERESKPKAKKKISSKKRKLFREIKKK